MPIKWRKCRTFPNPTRRTTFNIPHGAKLCTKLTFCKFYLNREKFHRWLLGNRLIIKIQGWNFEDRFQNPFFIVSTFDQFLFFYCLFYRPLGKIKFRRETYNFDNPTVFTLVYRVVHHYFNSMKENIRLTGGKLECAVRKDCVNHRHVSP